MVLRGVFGVDNVHRLTKAQPPPTNQLGVDTTCLKNKKGDSKNAQIPTPTQRLVDGLMFILSGSEAVKIDRKHHGHPRSMVQHAHLSYHSFIYAITSIEIVYIYTYILLFYFCYLFTMYIYLPFIVYYLFLIQIIFLLFIFILQGVLT